ncbi:MAG: putative inorganic carbon transporter subunit DabA [Planctomycetaceae bacterium]
MINSQYSFSTLDNVAYGAGSKVTQNVTGKLGVMQGNASDLMHGLPLQSVFAGDGEPYHEPLRLLTVVYAPREMLDRVIQTQDVLIKLFGNGWVTLACIDPTNNQAHLLQRDFKWVSAS